MVESRVVYQGDLRCQATHGPSGMTLLTDAPTDNNGKGESFSPTDLVGVALAGCILTTMGIVAQRHNIELAGSAARIEKHMVAQPARRIGRLVLEIQMKSNATAEQRAMLERVGHACPVHRSLNADIEFDIRFGWDS